MKRQDGEQPRLPDLTVHHKGADVRAVPELHFEDEIGDLVSLFPREEAAGTHKEIQA